MPTSQGGSRWRKRQSVAAHFNLRRFTIWPGSINAVHLKTLILRRRD
jgi:hypothetical protein